MLNVSLIIFALDRTPGSKGPTASGLVCGWLADYLRGGAVWLCGRASCGLHAVCGSPDGMVTLLL